MSIRKKRYFFRNKRKKLLKIFIVSKHCLNPKFERTKENYFFLQSKRIFLNKLLKKQKFFFTERKILLSKKTNKIDGICTTILRTDEINFLLLELEKT